MLYQQKPNIVCAEVEGQVVLLHPDSGGVLVLNEAGTCIWQLLRERTSLEKLVGGFTAVYQTTTPQATRDITAFVQTLRQKGLLHEA